MLYRIRVYGIVQGVGFRPTVARHAARFEIKGTVSNKGPFVEIMASGDEKKLEAFAQAIKNEPPRRAVILKVDIKEMAESPVDYPDFQIIVSEKTKGEILISPDIAICETCKKEMFDKDNRRYLHPFINCTCCGPRMTILDTLPYDRERTSMKEFPMCPVCHEEYVTPRDRRFDAQPVCCNTCGPAVFLLGEEPDRAAQKTAITKVRRTIAEGKIAAIKGIGGYHLCCDATNEAAVALLRARKKRPMKPFAVMMRNIEVVKENCELTPAAEEIVTGHQKPILLLKKKKNSILCEGVAPGHQRAGVMLPYAPVQMLLFDYDDDVQMPDALVMTSANESKAPICHNEAEAERELSALCDAILANNRKIRIRADDTVMDFYKDRPYMIRRSRGYAPLPIVVDGCSKEKKAPKVVLGIGGELKNSFCLRVNDLCYMSPYIGDMEDIRTLNALKETIGRFEQLLEAAPEMVVCDLHPGYNTTQVAESLGLPVVKIQHHYAHILSCMAENNYRDPVIGIAFDGTGYGTDKTIWGGEILLSDRISFMRSASIVPFIQVGGDVSAKEGYRIAVSMIYGLAKNKGMEEEQILSLIARLKLCETKEAKVIMKMADLHMNAVVSTSAGRLFDSVSAILGIRLKSTYEGEASCALQFAAERYVKENQDGRHSAMDEKLKAYAAVRKEERIYLPTDHLVEDIIKQKLSGENVGYLAYYFHAALSFMAADACEKIREDTDKQTVALSGGCFQNTLLLSLTEEKLTEKEFTVLTHSMIPPNDGGIALGQAAWMGGYK